MSRYSLPWLHSDDSADTASKKSAPSTKKSSAGFFYPPLSPPASSSTQAMVEPLVPPVPRANPPLPPHPYQVAGLYDYHPSTPNTSSSYTQLHPGRFANDTVTSSSDGDGEKPAAVQNTYVIQHQHHHHHHHHPQHPPPPVSHSPNSQVRPLTKLRPLIFLLVFLPVPPLLSLIYLVIGHAIFRQASFFSTPWTAPLLSSANAGATGGIILSLPIFLLLFLMLFPVPKTSPTREAHEDFFEDDESHAENSTRATKFAAYVICVVLTFTVGGAAGALGVTCLGGDDVVDGNTPKMLTLGRAAKAGLVGGAVLWAAVMAVLGLGSVGWFFWRRQAAQKLDK